MARVEALLFLTGEPLSSRRIGQLAGLADGTEARTLVRRLGRMYDIEGNAFCVEEVAGGFQLLTRPQFGGWLRRLWQSRLSPRLSAPALETLAVVAYRQPVPRPEVEAIRGVQCGEMLRQLLERGLVRIAGRSHELGRPFLYATTKQFLQTFGLRHLDDLPRIETVLHASPGPHSEASPDCPSNEITQNEVLSNASRPMEVQPNDCRANSRAEKTPCSDLNEERAVSIVANLESSREDTTCVGPAPGKRVAAESPQGSVVQETDDDLEFEDDDEEDDDDVDDDEEDDDDDLEDDDLEDEEWEEVDDDDEEDDDDDDDDWDDDDDDDDDWDDDDEEEEDEGPEVR